MAMTALGRGRQVLLAGNGLMPLDCWMSGSHRPNPACQLSPEQPFSQIQFLRTRVYKAVAGSVRVQIRKTPNHLTEDAIYHHAQSAQRMARWNLLFQAPAAEHRVLRRILRSHLLQSQAENNADIVLACIARRGVSNLLDHKHTRRPLAAMQNYY